MGDDAPQPDISLRILPEYGGRSKQQGIFTAGAPELIVEVSSSSEALDLGPKLHLYQRTGVREYITALLGQERVIWRQLVKGRYQAIESGEDGILRSAAFPGLWLDPGALWRCDALGLVETLERGLATPEHADFVRLLESRRQ